MRIAIKGLIKSTTKLFKKKTVLCFFANFCFFFIRVCMKYGNNYLFRKYILNSPDSITKTNWTKQFCGGGGVMEYNNISHN